MIASMTTLPVIGVPVRTKTLLGLDSLLSIVHAAGRSSGDGRRRRRPQRWPSRGAHTLPFPSPARRGLGRLRQALANRVIAKAERLEGKGPEAYLEGISL